MEHEYVQCSCTSREHTIHLSIDREDNTVYVGIALTTGGFFYRLKHAIKYLFGYQCKYGVFDEMIWEKDQRDKITKLFQSLDG